MFGNSELFNPDVTMASASFGPLVDPDVRLSTVIEQHDSLTILKGRTDQDVWNYINLSDDELTAINELRLLVRSTGIDLLTHKFCGRS